MGIYARIAQLTLPTPKQSCVLCAENAQFCICHECQAEFTNHTPRCQSCAHPLSNNLDFCGQCLAHAPRFNRAYAAYDYQSVIADLIKMFKYNRQLCIGDYFARQLADLYQSIGINYDAIIPMPLSRVRIKERGYNQVLELLRVIARDSHINIDTRSVERIKATQALSGLGPDERKQEIKGAFQAKAMKYQKVLLVDDIMTTGASLNELAKTVLSAGAQSVDVLVLARAESK